MLDKIKTENILFIDIETAAQVQDYNSLSERFKELWAKKMQWRIENEQKSAEELFEKAAIWSEFGKVICISAGYIIMNNGKRTLRLKSFYGHDEKLLLENFAFLLTTHFNKDKHFLCAHNGKEFDFPYIARRMVVNEIPLPRALNIAGQKPWEVKHLDTMELWKFGDHKHYTSLDLLAAIFNIPSPKTQIDGSQVNKIYWNEDDLPKIADYCQRDVITLCKLLLKFKGEHAVDELHIEVAKPSLTN